MIAQAGSGTASRCGLATCTVALNLVPHGVEREGGDTFLRSPRTNCSCGDAPLREALSSNHTKPLLISHHRDPLNLLRELLHRVQRILQVLEAQCNLPARR